MHPVKQSIVGGKKWVEGTQRVLKIIVSDLMFIKGEGTKTDKGYIRRMMMKGILRILYVNNDIGSEAVLVK